MSNEIKMNAQKIVVMGGRAFNVSVIGLNPHINGSYYVRYEDGGTDSFKERFLIEPPSNSESMEARIAELEGMVKGAFIEGCSNGYHEGLSDGQTWTNNNCFLDKELEWELSDARKLLEQSK